MTYRERRQARAERLRGWAATRQQRAAAVFKAGEPFTSDIAFNTQPGHIPFRARLIAREERAYESTRKAASMESRADGIEAQLEHAIYSDDPDAIARLEERLVGLEAERERIKAYNASCRRGAPDLSLLDDRQRANIESAHRLTPYNVGKRGEFPAYHLSNLSGNITRNRQRLEALKRRAAPVLVSRGVSEGLKGYLAKVAVVRDGDAPIGTPGPLYLNCPCGAKPSTRLDLNAPDVICACGTVYSPSGWKR